MPFEELLDLARDGVTTDLARAVAATDLARDGGATTDLARDGGGDIGLSGCTLRCFFNVFAVSTFMGLTAFFHGLRRLPTLTHVA